MLLKRGLTRLGLAFAFAIMALVFALVSPSPLAAADSPTPSGETAALTLGLGGAIAGTVAIIKAAVPTMPSRVVPLVVLAVSAAFVLVASLSAGTLDPLAVLLTTISQAMAAMGWREGVTAAAPGLSSLSSLRGGAAPYGAPPNA